MANIDIVLYKINTQIIQNAKTWVRMYDTCKFSATVVRKCNTRKNISRVHDKATDEKQIILLFNIY